MGRRLLREACVLPSGLVSLVTREPDFSGAPGTDGLWIYVPPIRPPKGRRGLQGLCLLCAHSAAWPVMTKAHDINMGKQVWSP